MRHAVEYGRPRSFALSVVVEGVPFLGDDERAIDACYP